MKLSQLLVQILFGTQLLVKTLAVNVEQLTDEQFVEFKDTFSIFDKDGNGQITDRELASVMRNLGLNPTQEQLYEMIREADADSDGMLDFPEFLNLLVRTMYDAETEVIQRLIRCFVKQISTVMGRKSMLSLFV
eukprot:171856_1